MVQLLLCIGAYLALAPHGNRYTTPVGGVASVPIADGSQVTLNTDSQIRIALTNTERDVELRRGEAFFEVHKDPTRPFVVQIGDKRVIAVGTKFSVRRDGDDVEVVVTEGKVQVEDGAAAQASRASGSADVFLTPGSVAHVGEAGILVQRKTLSEGGGAVELARRGADVPQPRPSRGHRGIQPLQRPQDRDSRPGRRSGENRRKLSRHECRGLVRLLESGFPVRVETNPDQIVLTAK